jgi:hypothetical protein
MGTYSSDEDEERLEDLDFLREQVETQVDEDEGLRELGEDGEHVLCRALRSSRHGVVGVVLQGNAAEEEGDDPGHVHPSAEEVRREGEEGDDAALDARVEV